jgi:hypothetical protein
MKASSLFAFALVLSPAGALAQLPPSGGGPPPEIQAKLGELQSIK